MSPRRASSEVRATRMKCSATPAPVMNHLWPWITQLSPFFSARVRIMPGSEPPPGAGSVMAKDERTLPSTIGLQPFVLLRRRAGQREQVHVAVVGRRAIERERPEDRAVRLLVHRRPADDRQRHAAVLLRRLRRPQARGPGLGLHRRAARRGGCSRARRSSPRRLRAAARAPRRSARVRRRMSSISGGSVKSMVGPHVTWTPLPRVTPAAPPSGRRRPRWWCRRCSGRRRRPAAAARRRDRAPRRSGRPGISRLIAAPCSLSR